MHKDSKISLAKEKLTNFLNRYVKNKQLKEIELDIFDKVVSRKEFLKGTGKISALVSLVSSGVLPSAWGKVNPDIGLSEQDIPFIPNKLKKYNKLASLNISCDLVDSTVMHNSIDHQESSYMETIFEGSNLHLKADEELNANSLSVLSSHLNNKFDKTYGHPELAQISYANTPRDKDGYLLNAGELKIFEWQSEDNHGGLQLTNIKLPFTKASKNHKHFHSCAKFYDYNHIVAATGPNHNRMENGKIVCQKLLAVARNASLYDWHDDVYGWFKFNHQILQGDDAKKEAGTYENNLQQLLLYYKIGHLDPHVPFNDNTHTNNSLEWKKYDLLPPLKNICSRNFFIDITKYYQTISISDLGLHKTLNSGDYIYGTISLNYIIKIGFIFSFDENADEGVKTYFYSIGNAPRLLLLSSFKNHDGSKDFDKLPDSFYSLMNGKINTDDPDQKDNDLRPGSLPEIVEDGLNSVVFQRKFLPFAINDTHAIIEYETLNGVLGSEDNPYTTFISLEIANTDFPKLHEDYEWSRAPVHETVLSPLWVATGYLRFCNALEINIREIFQEDTSRVYEKITHLLDANKPLTLNQAFSIEDGTVANISKTYIAVEDYDKTRVVSGRFELVFNYNSGFFSELRNRTINYTNYLPNEYMDYDNQIMSINHQGLINIIVCGSERSIEDGNVYLIRQKSTQRLSNEYSTPFKDAEGNICFDTPILIHSKVKRLLPWQSYFNSAEYVCIAPEVQQNQTIYDINNIQETNKLSHIYCNQDNLSRKWSTNIIKVSVPKDIDIIQKSLDKVQLFSVEITGSNAHGEVAFLSDDEQVEIRTSTPCYIVDHSNNLDSATQLIHSNRLNSYFIKPNAFNKIYFEVLSTPEDIYRGIELNARIVNKNQFSVNQYKPSLNINTNINSIPAWQVVNLAYKVHKRHQEQSENNTTYNQTGNKTVNDIIRENMSDSVKGTKAETKSLDGIKIGVNKIASSSNPDNIKLNHIKFISLNSNELQLNPLTYTRYPNRVITSFGISDIFDFFKSITHQIIAFVDEMVDKLIAFLNEEMDGLFESIFSIIAMIVAVIILGLIILILLLLGFSGFLKESQKLGFLFLEDYFFNGLDSIRDKFSEINSINAPSSSGNIDTSYSSQEKGQSRENSVTDNYVMNLIFKAMGIFSGDMALREINLGSYNISEDDIESLLDDFIDRTQCLDDTLKDVIASSAPARISEIIINSTKFNIDDISNSIKDVVRSYINIDILPQLHQDLTEFIYNAFNIFTDLTKSFLDTSLPALFKPVSWMLKVLCGISFEKYNDILALILGFFVKILYPSFKTENMEKDPYNHYKSVFEGNISNEDRSYVVGGEIMNVCNYTINIFKDSIKVALQNKIIIDKDKGWLTYLKALLNAINDVARISYYSYGIYTNTGDSQDNTQDTIAITTYSLDMILDAVCTLGPYKKPDMKDMFKRVNQFKYFVLMVYSGYGGFIAIEKILQKPDNKELALDCLQLTRKVFDVIRYIINIIASNPGQENALELVMYTCLFRAGTWAVVIAILSFDQL